MPYIGNLNIVMLAPEKRHVAKRAPDSQHCARDRLSLTFRQNPVLNSYVFAGDRVRISRDVPGCEYILSAGAQTLIHHDAIVNSYAGVFGQRRAWRHAYPQNHHLGFNPCSVRQFDAILSNRLRRRPQVEVNTMLFVKNLYECAELRTQYPLQRNFLLPHNGDFQSSIAERSSHFQADETGTDHDAAFCPLSIGNDRSAIG